MKEQKSKIQYLDGIRFKRVINAAAKRLIEKHDHLDAINVFPVPDGDTGKNMAGTMRSIVTSSSKSIDQSISKMSSTIAESALMGARGNSGVILAQFFCGFSEGVKDLARVSPKDFANAASMAAHRAIESISHPTEGTILTVIKDWAEHLKKNHENYNNFHDLLHDSLGEARSSLLSTKEKLASLKAADVVDAGAQGFVYLLEGIVEFTERGTLDRKKEQSILPEEQNDGSIQSRVAVEELTYTYCTECMLRGDSIDKTALRNRILPLGDSIVVAGTPSLVRIHIHTNEPDTIFAIAKEYGETEQHKAEDMLKQHQELLASATPACGIITDSTCDLPQEILDEYGIRVASLRMFLDDEEFIDKKSISSEEFNKRLRTSEKAHTSQPAPADFQALYEDMQQEFKEVAALHVMKRYSGTYQCSKTVGTSIWKENNVSVDTGTLTGGLGLVILEAAKRAKAGWTAADIAEAARKDSQNTYVYVSMDTLDFAVRGGRVSKGQGMLAKILNIKPVLEFDPRQEGLVYPVSKSFGKKRCQQSVMNLIAKAAENGTNLRFAVTHVDATDTAEWYVKQIKEQFGQDVVCNVSASAVLGCHSGPGACSVALLKDTD